MRQWLVALLLLLASAIGAAPKAVVKAPSVVPAGSLVAIDTSGTVSDTPAEVLLWPGGLGEGPEVGPTGALTGWRLTAPGPHTFFVVASGVPSGSNVLVRDVATAVVQVMPAGPPVRPNPPPASDPLSVAARAYLSGIPKGFRQTAADVRAGKVTTVDALIVAVGERRKVAGQALATEMDSRLKSMADPAGKILDAPGAAAALESAASAMEATNP